MKLGLMLGLLTIVLACDPMSDPTTTPASPEILDTTVDLPDLQTDGFCFKIVDISGGDLMASADRILVGTVTNVEVIDEVQPAEFLCQPENVTWTLRVMMDVSENLKGDGDTIEFFVGEAQYGKWNSEPMYLLNGTWRPGTPSAGGMPQPPMLKVSETLGWTENAGLQVGQQLLVFLWDYEGLSPGWMPMAKVDSQGGLRFQGPADCKNLPENYFDGVLPMVRDSLADAPIADPASLESIDATVTTSRCDTFPQPEFDTEFDAGSD